MALGFSWQGPAAAGGRLRRTTRKGLLVVEGWLTAAFGPGLNPLYHLGALTIFFFWVVLVTGVYLFIFFETSLSGAYQSVEHLTREQWYAGGVMRSLHRYASDAAVVTMALHLIREFVHDRHRGARWYSWFTGLPLVWLVYILGITGYWLVWDQLAHYIAVTTAEFLDALPVFTDPMARNFLTDEGVSDRFFTLMAFLHLLGVPLILVFAIWFHVLRITGPRVNPPRRLALGSLAALIFASLIWPAVSHPEATLGQVPQVLHLDWFYLPAYPLIDQLSPAWVWVVLVGGTAALALLPWLPPQRRAAAEVDLANCNGCGRCFADCPYSAIEMAPRTDGKRHEEEAVVDPALCTSCGVCAGACPSSTPFRRVEDLISGIELPEAPVGEMREVVEGALDSLEGDVRILAFTCEPGVDIESLRVPGAAAVRLPCVGMLPPAFIDYALRRRGADGVLIAACRSGDCQYRFGDLWLTQRLAGEREPHLKRHVDPARIRVTHAAATDRRAVRGELEAFRRALAERMPKREAPPSSGGGSEPKVAGHGR